MTQKELTATELPNSESADAIEVRLITLASVYEHKGDNPLHGKLDAESGQMQELIASVAANKVLQPIGVYPEGDGFVPIYGFCRVFACRQTQQTHIPARIFPKPRDCKMLWVMQFQENHQRIDVDPISYGELARKLKDEESWSNTELGRQLNLTPPTVTRILAAASLRADLKQLVSQGKLPVTSAIELNRLSISESDDLLPKVLSGDVTRDQLVGRRKRTPEPGTSPKRTSAMRAVAVLGQGRSVTVAGAELDLEGFIEALELCLARARKARPSGTSLTTFLRLLRDQEDAADPQTVTS